MMELSGQMLAPAAAQFEVTLCLSTLVKTVKFANNACNSHVDAYTTPTDNLFQVTSYREITVHQSTNVLAA